jgi:hypothetical protein
MGDLIELSNRRHDPQNDLICLRPFEFRKSDWESAHFVQMLKLVSEKFRADRSAGRREGKSDPLRELPPHFSLRGALSQTVRCLYAFRENEALMREFYYLVGLMDCMINQIHPILRTDLLRDMYKKVFQLRRKLQIHWYGPLDQVLLPLDGRFYNEQEYRSELIRARSLKELYDAIRAGTDEMFDILSLEYVFYCPNKGG